MVKRDRLSKTYKRTTDRLGGLNSKLSPLELTKETYKGVVNLVTDRFIREFFINTLIP